MSQFSFILALVMEICEVSELLTLGIFLLQCNKVIFYPRPRCIHLLGRFLKDTAPPPRMNSKPLKSVSFHLSRDPVHNIILLLVYKKIN